MMKKISKELEQITPKLIIIYLYLQPFLDILASVLINNNVNNYITSVIRFMFMFYLVFYLIICKYKDKKRTLIYLGLVVLSLLIHTLVLIIYKDTSVLFFELKNTISTFYFLFVLISLIVIYKNNSFDKKHLKNLWIIYLLLTFIPNVLGLSFDSYSHSKLGSSGWFYSANVLGSIFIILLPTILYEFKKDNKIYLTVLFAMMLYVLFGLGTKTPVLGLIIIILINILYYLYKTIKKGNKKIIYITLGLILLTFISSLVVIPKTNFYKNLVIHYEYLQNKNISIVSKEFLDNFVFSERLTLESETRKSYKNANVLEKIFGIGYIENYNTINERSKFIEMDYFDIFYKEGLVAFILYFMPVVYLIIKSIKKFEFEFKTVNYLISILLILLLAFFQGHIFITPQISIYVALLLVINSVNKEKI